MSFTHFLASRLGLSTRPASCRKTPAARPRFRPRLEALEERWLPSTLTVTTNADSGPGSLRTEISAAHKGDTIVFAPSLDGQTITLTSGELFIKQNLTINGPGAGLLTISGNKLSRVFELSSSSKPTDTLSGLTISNGDGVFAAGSSHTTDGEGGAILNQGTLTVSNCTLSGNSAHDGGAIHNDGTLTVSGSTLSGNVATNSGYGGAIANYATLTVNNSSTLSGNTAVYEGGGIFNGNTGTGTSTVTVSNSTLSDNSALDGGGIYNWGALTVSGCTLSGNSAHSGGAISNENHGTLMVSGCTLTGNTAVYEGGGILSAGDMVTVSNSVFSSNSPDNIYGSYTDDGGNTFS